MTKEQLSAMSKHELDVYLKSCNRQKPISVGKQVKLIKRRTNKKS